MPVSDVYIAKRELNVRDAWQIGRNDPDVVGIREDDDPIVPDGQQNAPVLEVLRWLQEILAVVATDGLTDKHREAPAEPAE